MACIHACQAECLFVNDGTLAHANTQREAISNGAMFVRQIYTNAFDLIRRVPWISIFRLSFNHTLETCANFIYPHLLVYRRFCLAWWLTKLSESSGIISTHSYYERKLPKCLAHRINNIMIVDIFRNLNRSTVSFYSRLIAKLFFVKLNWWWINELISFIKIILKRQNFHIIFCNYIFAFYFFIYNVIFNVMVN